MANGKTSGSQCPCDSDLPYSQCCEPLHLGKQQAITAQQLMRSRYTAYVLKLEPYLLKTWHADTRPQILDLNSDSMGTKWIGLKIIDLEAGNEDDEEGIVEFIARFKINGKAQRLHERSRFCYMDNQWFYIDGVVGDSS